MQSLYSIILRLLGHLADIGMPIPSMFENYNRPPHVVFPRHRHDQSDVEVKTSTGAIVIVGANGSGKSRLGSWIELDSDQFRIVRRISAQRQIELPERYIGENVTGLRYELLDGHRGISNRERNTTQLREMRKAHRWAGNPVTHTLNDTDILLNYLLSDHSEKTNAYYVDSSQTSQRLEPRPTMFTVATAIWEDVLPHLTLQLGGFELYARSKSQGSGYDARELSDGERVILYLAGQSVAAPPGSIIVVDEPEIHLHRAIQSRFWDAIERTRPDCIFIYITHDLEFAASRIGSPKIVVSSYDGGRWDWTLVDENIGIPEAVVLEILGSRKPILFCEGDAGSFDFAIYSLVYDLHTIIPLGRCDDVIRATASFQRNSSLHWIVASGIIDRDHRLDEEVRLLADGRVMVLEHTELENALYDPRIIGFVSQYLGFDPNTVVAEVTDLVLGKLASERDSLVARIAAAQYERENQRLSYDVSSTQNLMDSITRQRAKLDAKEIITIAQARVDAVIRNRDYQGALGLYNNKGIAYEISKVVKQTRSGYIDLIMRLIKSETTRQELTNLLKTVLPVISS